MDWFFQNKLWILALAGIGLLLVLLPVLFRGWVARRLGRADAPQKAPRASNVHPFPLRGNFAANLASQPSAPAGPQPTDSAAAAAVAAGQAASTTPAAVGDATGAPGFNETPSPFAIIAEVCSLQPPVRERVEQSYRDREVRWKLRLAGISQGVEQGPVRSIRMYPDARSAQGCGIYFVVNMEEHPELGAAKKDEVFVVEGTIENVSGTDIDLKNVHTVQKVA